MSEVPTQAPGGEVTCLLAGASAGDPESQSRLLAVVYAELVQLAQARMAGQAADHTLQATALVHETYLRLLGGPAGPMRFRGRAHFFRAAATAMRSILVDHARRRGAEKRGRGVRSIPLETEMIAASPPEAVCLVNDALDQLARQHERVARVVELLFFTGLSVQEAASVLEVSDRTVKRDWRFGRAWILRELGRE